MCDVQYRVTDYGVGVIALASLPTFGVTSSRFLFPVPVWNRKEITVGEWRLMSWLLGRLSRRQTQRIKILRLSEFVSRAPCRTDGCLVMTGFAATSGLGDWATSGKEMSVERFELWVAVALGSTVPVLALSGSWITLYTPPMSFFDRRENWSDMMRSNWDESAETGIETGCRKSGLSVATLAK